MSGSAKASAKAKLARVRAKLSIMATFQTALTASRSKKSENQPIKTVACSIPDTWKESFETLLSEENGRLAFLRFLEKEHSEENMHFWMACTHYSTISDDQQRIAAAQNIYNQHLDENSPEPVNVDSKALMSVRKGLSEPTEKTFSHAQKQIFVLMKTDSYRRFINSSDQYTCTYSSSHNSPSTSPKKQQKSKATKLKRTSGGSSSSTSPKISPGSSLAVLHSEQ